MRGGYLHHVLLAPIEDHFRQLGAAVHREHPVARGRSWGYADLFVSLGPHRIVCEAELRPDRIANDFAKAAALRATWLLIVTPTARMATAIVQVIEANGLSVRGQRYSVFPLGPALQRVRVCFPLVSFPIHPRTTNQKGRT